MDEPRFLPAGDAALLVELGPTIDPQVNRRVHALARALEEEAPAGLGEAVPSYRSVLVHYNPLRLSYTEAEALVAAALNRCQELPSPEPRTVEIPTAYGGEFGPDIAFVAAHNGLSVDEVIQLHSGGLYTVYMLGFTPGFPYLGGMPAQLATPRLDTPRQTVPAGAVGIAGPQTGIYPQSTPGGWRLIGRTPLSLFDPGQDPPALLRPGDHVRFVPISAQDFARLKQEGPGPTVPDDSGRVEQAALWLEILEGGLLTTVQDGGRYGYERYGVPVGGAADPWALRVANLLVGNPPGAAALEITAAGPILRPSADCLIAVAGADLALRVNGWPLSPWAAIAVRRGWVIEFGERKSGCRAVLAVAGGIAVPPVLGSRSTCLSAGFGGLAGRPLRAGDRLPVGPSSIDPFARAGRRFPRHLLPPYSDSPLVRVVLGPQDDCFTEEGIATFLSSAYEVGAASDRMGCRLRGPAIAHRGPAEIISDGIPLGAVQVPADGQPIVMLADRQTTGGYPKIATVTCADIPLLAQCLPGASQLRFAASGVEEAQARYREAMAGLEAWANS